MKLGSAIRLSIASASVFGAVLVVISQPSSKNQSAHWPQHSIIPASVSMNEVQEFKDVATLHLNDMQRIMTAGTFQAFPTITYVIDHSVHRGMFDHTVYVLGRITDGTSGGGKNGSGAQAKRSSVSAAELATLHYVFDEGVDKVINKTSPSPLVASSNGIVGKISPKDIGLSADQANQMTLEWIDRHPLRFWNQARVGLASGR